MIAYQEPRASTQPFQRQPLRPDLAGPTEDPLSLNSSEPRDMAAEPGWRIRKILVPTDFSACSAEAIAQAAALARRHDATLTILHVIDINPSAALKHLGAAEDLMRELWVTGSDQLRGLTELLAQNQTKAQTLIVEGLPAEAIVEHSPGFDLLVIGERRSKPAHAFFSRHTAQRVIEGAECPVLAVHQNCDDAATSSWPNAGPGGISCDRPRRGA